MFTIEMENQKFDKIPESKYGCNPLNKIILKPTLYLDKLPHQNYALKFVKTFNHWMKISENKSQLIIEIFDIITTVLCIYDDIEDNSDTRREGKSAHEVYGIPHAMFSANYAMLVAQNKVQQLNHPEAMNILIEELKNFYLYDCIQMGWRITLKYPSEEEYMDITSKKIAAYLNIPLRLMKLFTSTTLNFSELVSSLGAKIIITDDYVNLKSEEYYKYHGFCADLTEGKFTYPILHAIHTSEDVDGMVKLIQQKTSDDNLKKIFVNLLEKSGSLEYTKHKIQEIYMDIEKQVEKLGENPYFKSFLNVYKF